MPKFIRIDMGAKAVKIEECPEQYAGLAGRGLTSIFVANEVKPTCHPLGKNNKLICRALGLAEPTVKNHVSAILRALGVDSRTEAVLAVTRLGWALPQPR